MSNKPKLIEDDPQLLKQMWKENSDAWLVEHNENKRLKAENTRLKRVLMNIESAKRLHPGIPWEAMVMTLQDIARAGLKGGEG